MRIVPDRYGRRKLLEASTDFDAVKDLPPRLTPDELLIAAIGRNDSGLAKDALKMGAKADMEGGTPLIAAALRQNIYVAALLVMAGASISQSEKLARDKHESASWGDDPVNYELQKEAALYKIAGSWLREKRQEITDQSIGLLVQRLERLEGVERQLAELKEAVDAIVNPKAIDKAKLSIPKTTVTP